MIDARRAPGVWAVLTALDPDLPPDHAGGLAPGGSARRWPWP